MPAADCLERADTVAAVDTEVQRLPDALREPLVLCHLHELTQDEAAARQRDPIRVWSLQEIHQRQKVAKQ